MNTFLWGATAMGCWAVGLIFLKSWRQTEDRFFALFGIAFWLLAAHWTALALVGAVDETRHYFYSVRLAGFLMVLGAIADKNRTSTWSDE
ncbi:MAG: hypothetical protein EHM55_14840 [Acidobacteria bacterium]|nr:MAG: hypothetical protein EHM55_14840 [Acidobacteriota bacterium]